MDRTERKIPPEKRRRKFDEAQQFSEDRAQLLDTIREMIDIEFEHRGLKTEKLPHPESPPPENRGREPPDRRPFGRTLWQRIANLSRACLKRLKQTNIY
ncbi:hypothetical protein [Proteiniphilum sp. X52]|uniref:hypothetical protein n=1 Tax=Proteiniphilum sp. X52 TaxID=2382159 RepID=UPI000F0A4919|nr:hypothetical protein [Proteiniphilum sp. X52]RNC63369.1 hypothetical protein D7D25_16875 [Proteiniphilum sp. X52]